MQRSSLERARARASSAASERTSSGPSAIAGDRIASESAAATRQRHVIWPYSAGESAALLLAGFGAPTRKRLAGFGAPTRKRRSESDSAPPITITTAPNQMSSTNGL